MNSILTRTISAVADPTRRQIVEILSTTSQTVSELTMPFRVSFPAISKHLRVLRNAGLVASKREGRHIRYFLRSQNLHEMSIWIRQHEKFWNKSFDQLEKYLIKKRKEKSN